MSKTGAEIFLRTFQMGYDIGGDIQEKRKQKALSEAYTAIPQGQEVEYEPDVSAIPEAGADVQAARKQMGPGLTEQQRMLQEQAGVGTDQNLEIQRKVTLQDHVANRMRMEQEMRNAGVSAKEIMQYRKDYSSELSNVATKFRDRAVAAWQGGDFDTAARMIESSYQYIGDGADVKAQFVSDGRGGMALALAGVDETTGDATLERPILVSDPKQFTVLSESIIRGQREAAELAKDYQAMEIADAAEKREGWMFENTKDLVVNQKKANLLKTYLDAQDNRIKMYTGLAKVASDAASLGWKQGKGGSSDFLKAEKEMSSQINTLLTESGRIPEEKIQQRKSTAAAFLQFNPEIPVGEMANVSLKYSEMQDDAVSRAEQIVADSPQFAQLAEDTPEYRRVVREETKKLMKPHHEVIDGQTYFVSDEGYYKVPNRFTTGKRNMTYTDLMTKLTVEMEQDPTMARLAEVTGAKAGQPKGGVKIETTGTKTETTEPTAVPKPKEKAAIPTPEGAPAEKAKQGEPKADAVRTTDPIEQGMIPEVKGKESKHTYEKNKALNDSLRKVRAFAVKSSSEKPSLQDLYNAMTHPGLQKGEREAIQTILNKVGPASRGR